MNSPQKVIVTLPNKSKVVVEARVSGVKVTSLKNTRSSFVDKTIYQYVEMLRLTLRGRISVETVK